MNCYYYMSFAGEEGNRGVCIVAAASDFLAIQKTHLLGINPGGEILFIEAGEEILEKTGMEENRLYQRDELVALGGFVDLDGENVEGVQS